MRHYEIGSALRKRSRIPEKIGTSLSNYIHKRSKIISYFVNIENNVEFSSLKLVSSFKCLSHRYLIRVFEISSHGDAVCYSACPYPEGRDEP